MKYSAPKKCTGKANEVVRVADLRVETEQRDLQASQGRHVSRWHFCALVIERSAAPNMTRPFTAKFLSCFMRSIHFRELELSFSTLEPHYNFLGAFK